MYRRHSDEIRELRKRGLPWLASAILLLLLLIFGISIFIVLENQNGSSTKNLLFRWKHGSSEDYDEEDGRSENGSVIFITPLRKHGHSNEYSSDEDIDTLPSPSIAESTTTLSTLPSPALSDHNLPSTQLTTFTPVPATSLPSIVSSHVISPTSNENDDAVELSSSIAQLITSTVSPVSVPTETLNMGDYSLNSSSFFTSSTLPPFSATPSESVSLSSPVNSSESVLLTPLATSTESVPSLVTTPESLQRFVNPTKVLIPTTVMVTSGTTIPIDKRGEQPTNEAVKPSLEPNKNSMTTVPPEVPTTEKMWPSSNIATYSPVTTVEPRAENDSLVKWFSHAAVSCSEENCSEVGRNILLRGGNSVDAAIATDFCMGGMHPHMAGLGGSSVMLIHQPGQKPIVINGMSTSPRSATFNTFAFNPISSKKGYSSIACPGNLAALWNAYNRYGSRKLKWQDLLLPTIDILERGFEPSIGLSNAFGRLLTDQKLDPIVRKRLGGVLSNRTMYRNDPLVQTLRKLASSRDPYQLFYRGDLASQITQEIRSLGAILTKLDFINYAANIEDALSINLDDGRSVLGSPPPMTSLISQLSISHIIKKFNANGNFTREELLTDLSNFQNRVEDLRSGIADPTFSPHLHGSTGEMTQDFLKVLREKYGKQMELRKRRRRFNSKLENMKRVSSTIHVVDSNGIAVSLTSSLNGEFGAQRLSDRLGFFWNNYMAEFSLGETDTEDWNSVQGSKKPRSSLSPLMITQNDQVEAMIGLSTSPCRDSILAQVVLNFLLSDTLHSIPFPNSCDLTSSANELTKSARENESRNAEISLLYKKNNLIYSVCNAKENNAKCSAGF